MINIPGQFGWKQDNQSDKRGTIWSSSNLDLQSNEGKLRISPRTIITTDDITDLGVPVAFQTFTDTNGGIQYSWAVAGDYVFRMNLASGYQTAFAKDASAGTPAGGANTSTSSDLSDLVVIDKTYMVLSLTTRMYFYTASTGQWLNVQYDTGGTPTVVTVSDNKVHMMCVYAGRTYVTDDDTKVRSVANNALASASASNHLTTSGSNFLNLANKGYPVTSITTIRSVSDGIWVFTINQSEKGCYAFKWDGVTATDPNLAYIIPDASGILAAVIKDDRPWVIDNNGVLRYHTGATFLEAKNGRLPIRNSKLLKNSLSAVNDRWVHPNGMEIVNGRIRVLINNEYEDNGATIEENLPSGVWEYTPETGWVHIMSLSLYTSSVTDYGQNRVSRVGAIYTAKTETTNASANGTMLLGAQLFSDASTTKEVIAINDSNDTVQKYGYLVTPKIYSLNIEDSFKNLYVRCKKLLASTDAIIAKYRTSEVEPTEATITWTSATTCTTSTNVLAYIGYEMEVLQGKGGGKCSKITNVTESGGTYTITLQETFTGATSGTAKARFQYWIEIGKLTNQAVKFFQAGIGAIDTWIQLKLCMQFTGKDEVDDLLLENGKH